ncbi:MAS protein, partial [Nycticryphes semicollaris]|nr:MAS protein [Nycticryphes semicollaris]
ETNTTNLLLNSTDFGYEDSQDDTQDHCILLNFSVFVVAGVFIFISLCGLVGNMVVVWFLSFHMKRNPFTVYVLNLAIADFSLLLFILVILISYIISAVSCFFPLEYGFILLLLIVLFLFWYLASMYLLTAMSIERCASVL